MRNHLKHIIDLKEIMKKINNDTVPMANHMWVARDTNGLLKLFRNKPDKHINNSIPDSPYITHMAHGGHYLLDQQAFTNDEVNPENSPIEVVIELYKTFKQLDDSVL
jgi:hypothetical protein